jgi:phosphoribosyl 1,2-cyclic phosphodiesterase
MPRLCWGAMRICFWGTRGSIAKPGPTTVKYGGNTSCVEVRSTAGTLVVLDCGTGAHGLGQALLQSGVRPLCGHILISHTHWDHIQGIPFFAPLFETGNEWDIYAPGGVTGNLKETLAAQMQPTYFPVSLEQLGATIRYHDLIEGEFVLGDIRIVSQRLNHPALTLGYRLEADGASVVYATDHEPHSWAPAVAGLPAGMPPQAVNSGDRRHADFLAGADMVIHDAQYTEAEYPAQLGWGHSPVERVVDDAMAAGVKRLALFHHDPLREDHALEQIVALARRRIAATGSQLEVYAAAEGMDVELSAPSSAVPA